MKHNRPPFYIPDTSIVIHYARKSPVAHYVEQTYALRTGGSRLLVSIITYGELRAFALWREWGDAKRRLADDLLNICDTQPIDREEILDAYALLSAYSLRIGRTMGDNDLWIAATAFVTGATLLTTDKDFDHLHSVYIQREWIDPTLP